MIDGRTTDITLVRELQKGDPSGIWRRGMREFPDQSLADRVMNTFFVQGGQSEGKMVSTLSRDVLVDATVLSNFCMVWLAKSVSPAAEPPRPPPIRFSTTPRPRAVLTCSAASESGPSEPVPELDSWRTFRRMLLEGAREGSDVGGGSGEQCALAPSAEPGLEPGLDGEQRWAHRIPHLERGCLLVCDPSSRFFSQGDSARLEHSVLLLLDTGSREGSVAIALNRPSEAGAAATFGAHPLHQGGTDEPGDVFTLTPSLTPSLTDGLTSAGRTDAAAAHDDRNGLGQRRPSDRAELLLPGLWLERLTRSSAAEPMASDAARRMLSSTVAEEAKGGREGGREEREVEEARRRLVGDVEGGRPHFYAGAFVWSAGELEEEVDAGVWLPVAASATAIAHTLVSLTLLRSKCPDSQCVCRRQFAHPPTCLLLTARPLRCFNRCLLVQVDGDLSPENKYQTALAWAQSARHPAATTPTERAEAAVQSALEGSQWEALLDSWQAERRQAASASAAGTSVCTPAKERMYRDANEVEPLEMRSARSGADPV